MPTIGQLQASISEAIIQFEKEYMGRGPLETKTYIIEDLVIVRLKGVLTQAEHQLARTGETSKGRELIKQVRIELLERGRPLIEAVIESITGRKVQSLHTDISTITGERLIVFTLNAPLELDSWELPMGDRIEWALFDKTEPTKYNAAEISADEQGVDFPPAVM